MLVSTMFAQSQMDVHRGYRLHITNLEDRAFTYTIRFCVTPPTNERIWAASLNQFFKLYVALYGNTPDSWVQAFTRTGSIYVASMTFAVEAKHTVSVGITPDPSSSQVDSLNLLEGYVTLEVPAVRKEQGDSPFRSVPQAKRPVKVLLNPETTMVHTDTSGAGGIQNMDGVVTGHISVTRLNFDTVEPLIPASGKAENEIEPNGILRLSHDALIDAVKSRRVAEVGAFVGADSLHAEDRMRVLIELLCDLDTQGEFVSELNKVLGKNHATARICRDQT